MSVSVSVYISPLKKMYKIVVNIYSYNSKITSYNMLYKIESIGRNLKKTRDVLPPTPYIRVKRVIVR